MVNRCRSDPQRRSNQQKARWRGPDRAGIYALAATKAKDAGLPDQSVGTPTSRGKAQRYMEIESFFKSDGAEDGFAAEGSAKTVQGEGEADEEGKPGPG